MNRILVMLLCMSCLASCVVQDPRSKLPRRTTGLESSPDQVFKRPIAEVVPLLAGATARGPNGRIGPEMVFWSYQLADGRDVLLHICAELEDVDCEQRRLQRLCPAGEPVTFFQQDMPGDVRKLECQGVGAAATGDLRPGCLDSEFQNPLIVGLSSCQ